MKKALALVSSLLLIGGAQVYAADDVAKTQLGNIAVVNVQQVLQQSPKIAGINKKLQDQFKARQQKLLTQQKSLQDEMDKFKQESPTMNQKDKDAMQKKVATDQADLVKQVTAFQQDLNKEQNKQMQTVLSQLNGIISDLAKKSDYSLVLDSQAVIYAKDSSDITKQVAKEFDK
jgi:outer membrane protein